MNSQYNIKEINIEELSEKHFNQLQQIFIEHNERYNYPLPRDSDEAINKSMLQKTQFETKRRSYVAIHSETDEIHSYCNIVTNIGKTNRQSAYGRLVSLKSKQKQGIGKKLLASAINDIPEDVKNVGFSIRSDDTKRGQKTDSLLDLYLQRIGGKFVLSDRRSGSKISSFDKNEVKIRASELWRKAEKTSFEIYFVDGYNFKEQSNFSYSEYLKALEGIWNAAFLLLYIRRGVL